MQKAKRKPNMPVSFWQRFWVGQSIALEVPLALEDCRQQIEARAERNGDWYATMQEIDANTIAFTFYVEHDDSSAPSARISGTLTHVYGDNTLIAGNVCIPLVVRIMLLAFAAPSIPLGVTSLVNGNLEMAAFMLGWLLFTGIFFLGFGYEARRLLKHFRETFKEKEPDTDTALGNNPQYKTAGEILLQAATADGPTKRQSMRLSQKITFEVPQSLDECHARINHDFNTRRNTLRARTREIAADQVAFKINYLGETPALIRPPIARVTGTLTKTGQTTRVVGRMQFPWESALNLIFSVVLFGVIVWVVVHFFMRSWAGESVTNMTVWGGALLMTLFLIGASYKIYVNTAQSLAGALHTVLNAPPDMDEIEIAERGRV